MDLSLASVLMLATAAAAASIPQLYSLKTSAPGTRFHNLCVLAYHTGAGFNDATLSACDSNAKRYFDYNGGVASNIFGYSNTSMPYAALQTPGGISYNAWYAATISAGAPDPLLYSNDGGFVKQDGAGFLACDWAHYGVPQLFTFAYPDSYPQPSHGQGYKLPKNCAIVKVLKDSSA